MKKIIAVICAAMMLVSFSTVAFAEETLDDNSSSSQTAVKKDKETRLAEKQAKEAERAAKASSKAAAEAEKAASAEIRAKIKDATAALKENRTLLKTTTQENDALKKEYKAILKVIKKAETTDISQETLLKVQEKAEVLAKIQESLSTTHNKVRDLMAANKEYKVAKDYENILKSYEAAKSIQLERLEYKAQMNKTLAEIVALLK